MRKEGPNGPECHRQQIQIEYVQVTVHQRKAIEQQATFLERPRALQRNTLAFELQLNTLAFDTAPLDLSGQCPGEGEKGRLEGDRGSREWRPEWRAHRREDRRKSEMAGDGWRRGLGWARGRSGSREQALNRQAERTAASSRRRHGQEPGKGWGEPRTVRRERRPVRFRDAKDARGNRERVQAKLTNRGPPAGSHGPPVGARRSRRPEPLHDGVA